MLVMELFQFSLHISHLCLDTEVNNIMLSNGRSLASTHAQFIIKLKGITTRVRRNWYDCLFLSDMCYKPPMNKHETESRHYQYHIKALVGKTW